MKLHWADLMAIAALMAAGGGVAYAGLRGALRRAVARQDALERELHSLSATVTILEARLAALHKPVEAPPAPAVASQSNTIPALAAVAEEDSIQPRLDGVEPEMVAVLVAAAKAALGRNVRLLSARLVPVPVDTASTWSQQGRAFVHASHNLR
ncbi:MAG: hypothetical protein WCE75_16855 [Terracidiphilus sp.]